MTGFCTQAKKTKKVKKTAGETESALQDAATKMGNSKEGERIEQPKMMIGGTMKNYQVNITPMI